MYVHQDFLSKRFKMEKKKKLFSIIFVQTKNVLVFIIHLETKKVNNYIYFFVVLVISIPT